MNFKGIKIVRPIDGHSAPSMIPGFYSQKFGSRPKCRNPDWVRFGGFGITDSDRRVDTVDMVARLRCFRELIYIYIYMR